MLDKRAAKTPSRKLIAKSYGSKTVLFVANSRNILDQLQGAERLIQKKGAMGDL